MPLWDSLTDLFADDLTDFSPLGPIDALSAYEHEFGRAKLIERLTDVLHINKSSPGDTHRAFCQIPFDIVCTTNFDYLLEQQYTEITSCHIIIDEDQLSINQNSSDPLLVKLHGDLRHPSRLIATENDYDSFINKYPLIATYLSNLLISKTAILIGYSLDDPDFRQLWNVVSSRLGKNTRPAYALVVDASPTETARFERRGVKVINLPGSKNNYGKILENTFKDIHNYWLQNALSEQTIRSEDPLLELLLPRHTPTRLCFFSVPKQYLSIYRKMVFPVVEDTGFVPVTIDDVLAKGNNIRSITDTLIDRASVVVVDTQKNASRERDDLKLAQQKKHERAKNNRPPLEIIEIIPKGSQPATEIPVESVIHRGNVLDQGIDKLLDEIKIALEKISTSLNSDFETETSNLMAAGEHKSALISAISHLENALREYFEKHSDNSSSKYVNRAPQLRKMIEESLMREILTKDEHSRIIKLIYRRNEAVHRTKNVTAQNAREAIELVRKVLERLRNL